MEEERKLPVPWSSTGLQSCVVSSRGTRQKGFVTSQDEQSNQSMRGKLL